MTTYGTAPTGYVKPAPVIVYREAGDCPSCRVGLLEAEISCLGVFCCIIFFPLGLICLLIMQEQRCPNCGYSSATT